MTTRAEFRALILAYVKDSVTDPQRVDLFIDSGLAALETIMTQEQEKTETLTLAQGVVPLPALFLKMREVTSNVGRERRILRPGSRTILSLEAQRSFDAPAGDAASYYGITGSTLQVPAGGDSDVDIMYWERITLDGDSGTHPATDRYPQALIQTSLSYAFNFLADFEASAVAIRAAEGEISRIAGVGGGHGSFSGVM